MSAGAFSYREAVQRLNSLQTPRKVLDSRVSLVGEPELEQMRHWLRCIGHKPSDLERLNIVHVSGTKGKGTTCAYVNSILRSYQQTAGVPRKIGLYTSPHLLSVRERIVIDSEPISEDQFAQYFSAVWHALEDEISKPTYFRFLTLMSFHVFLQENVDTAIYEVGVGGRYDSTNIVERPTVTGITRLGIDHVKSLGPTIDRIAWHKAGIMKEGAAAFTVDQVPEAMYKLRECAKEQKVRLEIVPVHPSLENEALRPFQKQNASVAIALSKEALKNLGIVIDPPEHVPKKMIESINATVWKGRCQKVSFEGNHWYLDCAHTEESLREAGSWFREASREDLPRVLIFNQQSGRDATRLLEVVHESVYPKGKFEYALFCTNMTHEDGFEEEFVDQNTDLETVKSCILQRKLASVWKKLDPTTTERWHPSIEDAVRYIGEISSEGEGLHILVTGSVRLVGGVMWHLERGSRTESRGKRAAQYVAGNRATRMLPQ